MGNGSRTLPVITHSTLDWTFQETPYALWVAGELHDRLELADDASHVEIIDGNAVVSTIGRFGHHKKVASIKEAFFRGSFADSGFPWRSIQDFGLNLAAFEDAYVPDLMVFDVKQDEVARRNNTHYLTPDQVELVVEVTSRTTWHNDLPPSGNIPRGKWRGYARAEIPYYLLVDDAPMATAATLYSAPDPGAAKYLHEETWAFGETIVLPEPFGVEIPTDTWRPWC